MVYRYSTIGGRPITEDSNWEFRFRGGVAALDLTATATGRLRGNIQDHLESGADLERWLRASGLAAGDVQVSDRVLAKAKELREVIYRLATARAVERAPEPEDVVTINRMAAQASAYAQLSPDYAVRLEGTADALVNFLARQGIETLGRQSGRIKQCKGKSCAILFLDTSRAGGRRWCSMESCGNRAKVAGFRRRATAKS